jgi:regulator of sigma E protease
MSFLLAFMGFFALILLHEASHFIAAKKVGMKADKFYIFFPPLIWKRQIGETTYGIGSIPLGGMIGIVGMGKVAEDLPEEDRERSYYEQPVWKRIVVVLAGPLSNIVLAIVLLVGYFTLLGPHTISNEIEAVAKGYPAQAILKPGDRVIAVDNKLVPEKINEQIASYRCTGIVKAKCESEKTATLEILRNGQTLLIKTKPVYDPSLGKMRIGFKLDKRGPREPLSLIAAVQRTIRVTGRLTVEVAKIPVNVFDPEIRKQLSSVVGGYEVTRRTIDIDIGDAISIIAVISLSLGVINLLPILPLDGGHILAAVIQKIRRKPIHLKTLEKFSYIGFVLIIILFLIGLSNDIDRLRTGGFDIS